MSFRILSLDGGGIRGVVSATMLAAIEKQINQPLNKYFDLIAGTSTGSILAAGVAIGLSGQEILEIYKRTGSLIFPYKSRFSWKRFPLLFKYGVSAPKFTDNNFATVLKEILGNTQLLDITDPLLLIVAYDTITRQPIVFKSWREDADYGNIPLWQVCISSSSAPTFFPAHKIERIINGKVNSGSKNDIVLCDQVSAMNNIYNNNKIRIIDGTGEGQTRKIKKYEGAKRCALIDTPWETIPDHTSSYSIQTIYSAIDGSVASNNPSSCAVAEALRLGHNLQDISVLSIGTGNLTRIIPFEKAEAWGLLQWAQPLISVLLDASSNIHEYITNRIMKDRVLRLQFKLDRDLTGKRLSDDIDDATPENINNLIEAAEVYIQQEDIQKKLQEFLQL
ncbi:patatin-like phospholipase family protein [Nodularia harveyana UHCC-0300]|uniref:Patatin-like phospholipase family protein n=1 Tax=Nodularia harveyana UHCC-0300 TaxID=2974287 RepID=A0ABU5UBQ1_9CYAN|nr:patatin-like phospholipase family protein [Nodularia harveyana]MEA5580955.1 patatin-like phospholipase family protein [Nodularia harveyana UHCC-0300]